MRIGFPSWSGTTLRITAEVSLRFWKQERQPPRSGLYRYEMAGEKALALLHSAPFYAFHFLSKSGFFLVSGTTKVLCSEGKIVSEMVPGSLKHLPLGGHFCFVRLWSGLKRRAKLHTGFFCQWNWTHFLSLHHVNSNRDDFAFIFPREVYQFALCDLGSQFSLI